MMDILKNIDWLNISSNVVVVGLLLWAAIKLYAKTYIEEKVKSGFSSALEEFKADLAKKNIAFGADYTFYTTEQSKVCIELYYKIAKFYDNAILLTRLVFSDTTRSLSDQLNTSIVYEQSQEELRENYNQNRIFVNEELSKQIVFFVDTIGNLCSDFSNKYAQCVEMKSDDKKLKATIDELKGFYSKVAEMKSVLDMIANSTRSIIQPKTEKQ